METSIQMLHLEDDPAASELVKDTLSEAGLACRITRVQTREEFEAASQHGGADIILADYRLPGYDGMSALRWINDRCPGIPFIFVTGAMGEEAAIEALTQGATDYVLKHNLSRLASAVRRALQEARNRRERRQALEALQRSNEMLRAIIEAAPVAIIGLDLEGRVHSVWNPAAEKMLGWSAQEVLGRPLPAIPADRQKEFRRLREQIRGGVTLDGVEVRWQTRDATSKNYSIYASPLHDTQDRINGNIAVLVDITERKQAEQQVALMRFALNGIHEAAFMLDEKARFQYVNDEACRILGYSRNELLTMGAADINANWFMEQWPGHWNDLNKHGSLIFEGQYKAKDGRIFPVEINANYIEHDGCSYDLCLSRDITERKQAECERLANLRFFESMDRVNRAIQGADDLEEMMRDLLDVVLSIFDCDRAFLVYPCDPESQMWTSPMERNKPEYPGVRELKIEMAMDLQIAAKHRILLAADGPVAFGPGAAHALPEDVSKQFNIKCMMAMAIYPKTEHPWEFGIHQCAYARVWTTEEMRILEAIGRRLTDSLSSLLSYRDLRKNEEFLDKVVEHIPNMIFVKDAQTLRYVRFNKAGERLVGCSREELLGKSDHDLFPKEEADFFTAMDRRALTTGQLVRIPEETMRNRRSEERILQTQKIPILDEAGNPQFLLGISEDITERKRTEESVRKLSHAIEQSPVSIVITDAAGNIEFANTKFTQITGYTLDEALGRNPSILKSGEMPAEDYRRLWETISSGGVWRGEFHNRKKNGELFWEQATIAPVRNADNVITHYVAVKEDITERKKLEEQLRQAQKMEAVGQLAGGVAHDFNNMLGVIIGHAEIALKMTALDESINDHLVQIIEAGRRSTEIIRQLLAFARKQAIVPKILDLNETVEGMLKLLRRLIGEGIDLAWLPGAKLWPIKLDPSQVDQILANLCVNAKDAITGVGKITIETHRAVFDDAYCAEHRGFSPGEYVQLAVSDNGSGMDKTTMDHIFEPFFTTKGVGKGTGLGLATVYGIVKQNDGFINVYSEPGYGSTLKVYLPRHKVAAGQEQGASREPKALRGHETILVVEDEASYLKISKLILEKYGYRVLTAPSPGEALLAAKKHTGGIHLLLTDLIMPEMNGRDLAKEMTFLYPNICCLFMSGYSANIIVHQCILDEGIHFIQKPFSNQALAAKVREVLDAT